VASSGWLASEMMMADADDVETRCSAGGGLVISGPVMVAHHV